MRIAASWIPVVASIAMLQPQPRAPLGTIAGRVITMDTQTETPLRRAIVTASGDDPMNLVSVVTDDDGKFVVANLAPGGYSISASKAPFVTEAYGATLPGLPGRRVTLVPGQRIDDLQIVLQRGGVIAGMIRGPDGHAIPEIQVAVSNTTQRGTASAHVAMTDDRGEYRVYGLEPGAYTVAALPAISDQTGLTLDGREQLDQIFSRLSVPSNAGPSRAGSEATILPAPQRYGYARVFYPGTAIESNATVVTLQTAEERTGVDIQVVLVRLAHISGSVVPMAGGAIPPIRLTLVAPSNAGPARSVTVDQAMPFAFDNLAPGRYGIVGQLAPSPTRPSGAFAITTVTVDGADIDGLRVPISNGLSIAGRVQFDTAAGSGPSLAGVSVELTATAGSGQVPGSNISLTRVPAASIQSDGRFAIDGVAPGRYVPALKGMPAGWWLRSAVSSGRDLLDAPLEIGPEAGAVPDLVLTLTSRHSQLFGTLSSADNAPVPDYVVVVFPEDRAQWIRGSRRLRLSLSGPDGSYSFGDLPGGSYRLAALSGLPSADWQAEAFLSLVRPLSVPVTVVDGQHVSQGLRLTGG